MGKVITVTLSTHDVMLERLLTVSTNSHLIEKLYPDFLSEAGKEHSIAYVVLMLVLKIQKYATNIPFKGVDIYKFIPMFIDAVIVDTYDAELAKILYLEALGDSKD